MYPNCALSLDEANCVRDAIVCDHISMKECRRLNRFLLRGLDKVKAEFSHWSLTHNLLKLQQICGKLRYWISFNRGNRLI